ncbi:winged helix-turn-helix transcriptional regulator [bacterium]|nr:winged helix-turn-helix transcriptional regulator [bacterium]
MEAEVSLFRVLANLSRIEILRLVTVLGEQNVSQIADATGQALNVVSTHLRRMAGVGLLKRRRSGREVYYQLVAQPRWPLTRAVVTGLRDVFESVRVRAQRLVARGDQSRSKTRSDAALFALFTAFTHPRRIRIIRRLASGQGSTLLALSDELRMSPGSCEMHMAKLERRGMVGSIRAVDGITLHVVRRPKGGLQRTLFDAILV